MNPHQTPAKWPFPPVQQQHSARSRKAAGRASQVNNAKNSGLTRGAMLIDICLVAIWGATIPGLMWLGAAGGF